MAMLNLSFAACGFLGIYQLGVVEALLRHGAKLLNSVKSCAGASAGALAAAVLITAPDKLELSKDFTYAFASEVRKQRFGAVTPGYDFMLSLRRGIEDILPLDAHEIAKDRLHVSITHLRTRENCIVSSFASREDLIKVLLASSFIPIYAGTKAVEYKGESWMDGALTDGLPVLPEGRTVTVSPFSGLQDICPEHDGFTSLQLTFGNMCILLSTDNIIRVNQALFPPGDYAMKTLNQEGYGDTVRFLKKENWFE